MNPLIHFPAHLLTGNITLIEKQVLIWLQEIFLKNHACTQCSLCTTINEKNFYGFSWITPENRYTLETLTPIFHKITFQLEESQHHFFIITRAELLTAACANTLLKIVEEPPAGYHFIFIAPHKNLVLPTIVSRCIETHSHALTTDSTTALHPLLLQATSMTFNWNIIHKEISMYSLSEHETLRLFEHMITLFTNLYKESVASSSFSISLLNHLLSYCKDIIKKPLQPGSSKIIWKDFFMYKALLLNEK